MQWILAFHIIFMVAWFAALFYLPRLFVYHAAASDTIGIERFKVMEYRLYRYIMTPAAILTTLLGLWLLWLNWDYYRLQGWMHAKLFLVLLLWGFHGACGRVVRKFRSDSNTHSEKYFRYFNEVPTVLLIAIVILVVVRPF